MKSGNLDMVRKDRMDLPDIGAMDFLDEWDIALKISDHQQCREYGEDPSKGRSHDLLVIADLINTLI
jgi:hypothetical protein